MNITCAVYKQIINNVPMNPPEMGGILGGDNNIVDCVVFDTGLYQKSFCKCSYVPNVYFFNKCIENWQNEQIDFYGMFHTHFYGVSSLSYGDKEYMKKIMQAMPVSKEKLYFPVVVLPERKIVSYVCRRTGEKIEILKDEINLCETT